MRSRHSSHPSQMLDSNANQDYARYMLRWIEALEWPEFPLAEAELPALRGYWVNGDLADLDAIEARLWAWVDAHGGPAQPVEGNSRLILARMLICMAQPDNRELRERGYFEELLARAGVPADRINASRPGRRTPWHADAATADVPEPAQGLALAARYQSVKRQVLMGFCAVSFISGATVGQKQLEPVWICLMAFLIYLWYRVDSDQRSFPRTTPLTATVILIAAVGIPWYLLSSRPGPEGRNAVLQAVGMFLLSLFLSAAGAAWLAPA